MKYVVFILFSYCLNPIVSQNNVAFNAENGLHYGASVKLNVEIQPSMKSVNFKLSAAAGIGLDVDEINLFPTIHAGIMLFNRGTIGSSLEKPWRKISAHLFYSALATVELDKRDFNYVERYVPFYHFSDFSANPLQNPYKSSVSLGGIWVYMQNSMQQRLGMLNINIMGRGQITYYNDGGPVLSLIGDKRDRYYTGGVLLSYHGNEQAAIDLIEISYHKFTGYVRHAFDIADKLQIDYLVYADKSQFTFNHQRWKINVSDVTTGYSGNFSMYDVNSLDLQDFLHFNTNVPYHPDYFSGWRLAFGGRYDYNYLRLGND